MVPEFTSRSNGRTAGAPKRVTGTGEPSGWDEGTVAESEAIVREFLGGRPASVRMVAGWARSVAAHRIWGFENTEDIVQATLLALVQNLREQRFKGGNLRAYVRRIAKNMCISYYRKVRTRGSHVPFEEDAHHSAPQHPGKEMECRTLVDRIFERLTDACRQIILLAYIHGYSRKEISDRLGITEEATRVKLYRCIRNARTLLNGFGDIAMAQG